MPNPSLAIIDQLSQRFATCSDAIWDAPELAFVEHQATVLQCDLLRELGFDVTENLCNIPTAFSGTFGTGKPVIGILGEFDALSGMSQQADAMEKAPLIPNGPGHGCGHNLLGVGGIAAAAAIKDYLCQSGASGTVVYFGCPAEEGGSGKAFMARDGAFDGVDCALAWHPSDSHATNLSTSLANYQIAYKFKGISSHAAGSPHLGRSALDAVELMNVGVQFLREHIIPEARVHYAITDTGGQSPNVVQAKAEALYLIRAPKTPQVEEIYQRVNKIAQGAALMTETEVEISFIKSCANVVPNQTISRVVHQQFQAIPCPTYTQEEQDYAKEVKQTIGDGPSFVDGYGAMCSFEDAQWLKGHKGKLLNDFLLPYPNVESTMPGSTDVGDVSWVCPTGQCTTATCVCGTPFHSWQLVAQGKSTIAHKGMAYAAKILASTAIALIESPETIDRAKEELAERLDHKPFVSSLPKDVVPQALIH